MIAALMIGVVVLTALLASASLRLDGLAVSLLAAYVIAVAEVTALTAGLSPFRAVERPTLALAEGGLLAVAAGMWWVRGKPRLPVRAAAGALANAFSSPVVAVLAAVVGVALVYELLLVLLAHPNNWDSLTYHLARAAAWTQHGGVYWIPNAPTDRMNEFQPVAEQQVMFLFVAAGRGAFFALPQFAGQIAIMASIFVSARRLGYERRSAVCAALLFATFTLVALEATTAQNDLVAASFPACAASFLLSGGTAPVLLAGVAVGLGLGVKLTTALVVPVLVVLAIRLGRRSLALFACASTIAFGVLSLWGFVLNLAETGQWLGRGGGRVENEMSPSLVGSLSTAYRVVFRLLDLSGFTRVTGHWLAAAGLLAALAAAAWHRRRTGTWLGAAAVAAIALPALVPMVMNDASTAMFVFADSVHLPVNDSRSTVQPFLWQVNHRVNEDVSGFGPLGGVVLLAVSVLTLGRGVLRQVDGRRVAVALALPVFIVLLALTSKYNPWLTRFLIVPAAIAAPLLAGLFRRPAGAAVVVAVAAVTLGITHWHNELKPLSAGTLPWQLNQTTAAELDWNPAAAHAVARLDRTVPATTCVGAVLDSDAPSYLLYGDSLRRPVAYLRADPGAAARDGLAYVVISADPSEPQVEPFAKSGWRVQKLARGWSLAERSGVPGNCGTFDPAGQLAAKSGV